jgi:hypothetical protein
MPPSKPKVQAALRFAEAIWRARISSLYAALGEFENASREILSESVDLYAASVANWADSYEGVEPGLAGRVLAEITRIAGWFRDDWRQVHEIIADSRDRAES